jgi:hypothetical protein
MSVEGSFVLLAQIHARRLMNSWHLSWAAPINFPDFKALIVNMRFKAQAKPMRKPFSFQLYMFLVVMWYFLMHSVFGRFT